MRYTGLGWPTETDPALEFVENEFVEKNRRHPFFHEVQMGTPE